MDQHLTIREVAHGSPEYWETAELRNVVLRKPIGLEFSAADVEAEKRYRHLACYCGNDLAACLMLDPLDGGGIRMRQLAVAPQLQRQGIGKALVEYSATWAREAGYRRNDVARPGDGRRILPETRLCENRRSIHRSDAPSLDDGEMRGGDGSVSGSSIHRHGPAAKDNLRCPGTNWLACCL